MKYEGFISILFFGGPILLMILLPVLMAKNIKTDWKLILKVNIFLLAIACIIQINKPLLNGPITHIIAFILVPYNACLLSAKIAWLWKYKIIGIISVPVIYYIVWTIMLNIGILLGVLRP